MPQKLDDLFSQEELDSMSDEEKAEFEAELAADTDTDEDVDNNKDDIDPDADKDSDDTDPDVDTDVDTDVDKEGEPDADKGKSPEPEQRKPAQQDPPAKPDNQEDQTGDQAQPDPEAEKKAELQGKLKTLREQFEDSLITFEDYLEQRDDIKDELRDISTEARVREAIRNDKEASLKEQIDNQWKRDQESFFGEESALSVDSADFDDGLYKVFRQQAQIKLTDPAYAKVDGVSLLKEAAREARAIKGVAQPVDSRSKEDIAKARQKANKSSSKAANTLADIPNDAEQETSSKGKFDYIDRLIDKGKTIEAEKAIEKLSDDDKERYLRAS